MRPIPTRQCTYTRRPRLRAPSISAWISAGVFDTLKAVAKLVLTELKKK